VAVALLAYANAFAQPVIVTQPQPQQVPLGGSTTMLVDATGNGPLTYQWFHVSTNNPLPGATNTFLVINSAQTTNAGD
jgi:hypothetical protein